MNISKGKLEHLKKVSTKNGVIAAAAMDQRGSLQKSIAKEKGCDVKAVTPQMMEEFKTAVTKVLTPHATAILLDPEFGLPASKTRGNAGLILSYETTGYDQTTPGRLPLLIPNWTVSKSLEVGANAVKILLYYSPFEDKAVNEIKHAWVERIGSECAHHQIPYFLEFVGYATDSKLEDPLEYAKKKPEIVIESMKEFSKPKYNVDVLKVEIPIDIKFVKGSIACKGEAAYDKSEAKDIYRRSAAVTTLPFIYLSAGVSDDVFRESLELAAEADVAYNGVLCGRATWKEGIPIFAKQGAKALEDWLSDRGVKNIQALNKVLDIGARPWTQKVTVV